MTLAIPFPPAERPAPWSALASLAGHAALVLALQLLLLPPGAVEAPLPRSVEVDLISAAQFTAETSPAPLPATQQPAPAPAATPEAAPELSPGPAAEPQAPVEATQFYTANILAANPRIAAALPTLDRNERIVQLCNIEALEQIRAAKSDFAPDTLVAYAMADFNIRNGRLIAPGAAFRSRRRWFAVSLRCDVAPDFSAVTAFAFTIGAEIPRQQWDAHALTAEEDEE